MCPPVVFTFFIISGLISSAKVFNSSIGAYSYLGGCSALVYASVGKFCSIGPNSSIGLGHHTLSFLSTSSIFTEKRNGTGYSWTEKQNFTNCVKGRVQVLSETCEENLFRKYVNLQDNQCLLYQNEDF